MLSPDDNERLTRVGPATPIGRLMRLYWIPFLPAADLAADGPPAPYWNGLRDGRMLVQHCGRCGTWQFGPEWLCHACHAFDPGWQEVAPQGMIYSWERVWHPSHASLEGHGPYLVVLVELRQAGRVRMLGNLLGDAMQTPLIGAAVQGVFERHAHHERAEPPYTLLQWRCAA